MCTEDNAELDDVHDKLVEIREDEDGSNEMFDIPLDAEIHVSGGLECLWYFSLSQMIQFSIGEGLD